MLIIYYASVIFFLISLVENFQECSNSTAFRFNVSAEAAVRKCFTKYGNFYKIFDNTFYIEHSGRLLLYLDISLRSTFVYLDVTAKVRLIQVQVANKTEYF